MNVGVIGCGNISGIYLKNSSRFKKLQVMACSDRVIERAREKAAEYAIPKVYTVEELLQDPSIDIVLNLTIPHSHYEVAMKAIEAGKSVYNEKPLAITREQGRVILEAARIKQVRVGAAPDTFLGAGIQTCRKLIDDGAIGEPIGATAFMVCHGHESWHPDPEFYYQAGGGPMFDMGPYYLTALIALLGPVRRVTGSTRISQSERIITSEPKKGTRIQVEVPTHIAGIMDFESGAIGTILTSFDVWTAELPRIEIYGTEGTLSVPDPNIFGGPVRLWSASSREWREIPLIHPYADNSRGLGVAEMADAIYTGRKHLASGEMAYHVLDIMHAFHDSSDQGKHIELSSRCNQPELFKADTV